MGIGGKNIVTGIVMSHFSQVLVQKYSAEESELKAVMAPESHLIFT